MLESLKQLLVAFMIGLILCPPSMVYANGIQVDGTAPANNQATLDAAGNGVPVVNIAAPNGSGLSHNKFLQFNVGTDGVVLNNSTIPGLSQLGGVLAPNSNLNGTAASTILNEVTGTGRSDILGHTEIFGQAANYILANPNGISINGGGFINTPKATMTTGTPQFAGSNLLGINVTGGDILVHGAGINANNIDAFELVTRVATINADIYAKKLNVVTGQNLYDPASETVTASAPDGSPVPTISIDSSALGGMYAGRIKLVGTEAGVGVNTQGMIQSTEHLEMTADGKIQIKGTATSAQNLAITSTNDAVEVSGTVKAVDTATVTGQTVSVAKVDAADKAIIIADKVRINGGTLANDHVVAAESDLTVTTDNVTNTGTLYSADTALFRIGNTMHNDQGNILVKNNAVFEGSVAGQMMAALTNDSGVIESLDGGLTFRASDFHNNNSQFTLVEGGTVLDVLEGACWYNGKHMGHLDELFRHYIGEPPSPMERIIGAAHISWLSATDLDMSRNVFTKQEILDAIFKLNAKLAVDPSYLSATAKGWLNWDQLNSINMDVSHVVKSGDAINGLIARFEKTRDEASGQALGSILAAQGDILIESDNAKNTVSKITSATGNIEINATSFGNVGKEIYERLTVQWGRGVFHSHSSPRVNPVGSGTDVFLTPIDYAYGTLDAGNKVIISSGAVANGVVERNGIYLAPDPATQAQKVTNVTDITGAIPANGMYQPNTNPAQNYVVETNPAFTDLSVYYGTEYLAALVGFDPNAEANKRLGDAYYETQLVRRQIMELSGHRYLDEGIGTDIAQFKKLMDNAAQAKTALNLSVGISLTAEQVASLTDDIVWLERQTVNGEEVLVPVVYLASASLNKIAQGGSVIVGTEVAMNATGDVTNADLIQSDTQLVITADNFFNTKGTATGQTVAVTATDSIHNTGGTIQGDTVTLKAGNDVVSSSDTVMSGHMGSIQTQIARKGEIKTKGDLIIEAGGNIGIVGSDVESGGDTTLKAGKSVAISSQETVYSSNESGPGFNSKTDATYQSANSVKTGGDLIIEAGEAVSVHGSTVEAGGDVGIKANEAVSITSAQHASDFHVHSSGGGKTDTTDIKFQHTVVSAIMAGGSVDVESGITDDEADLAIIGSKIKAAEDVSLKSARKILLSSGQEENSYSQKQKSSGFFSSKSALSASGTVAQIASEVESGGSMEMLADSDITISASNIHGEQGVDIKSDNGDVRIAGGQNSEYSVKEEKKIGVGLFLSKGRLDVARFKEEKSKNKTSTNVGSLVTSGTDTNIEASNDVTIIGSTLASTDDVNIKAGRDANIIPGRNSEESESSKKEGGIGIGWTLSENEISVSAGYKGVEKKTSSSGEYNAGSQVSAGNDINVEAGRNVNQISSEMTAGRDVNVKAGDDLNITAAQDVEKLDEYVKTVESGIKLGVKQSVTTAVRSLAQVPKDATSGEGGAGATAITAGSSALKAVSSVQQISNPSASISLTAGLSMSESKFSSESKTSVNSQITTGRDVSLEAGNDMAVEGGKIQAGEDASLTAGNDISIASSKNSHETSSSSSSVSASAGIGATISAANGMAAGVQVSGSASGSDGDSRSDSNTNAEVVAGENLTVISGQDTTVAGANLEGNKVKMDIGGNLVVASKQDTGKSKSSNWSAGGTATVGMGASVGVDADSATGHSASIGMGKGSSSKAWVNKQTSIIGKEKVDIRVEDNTHVEGAVIAAENGNLKLDTNTLTYKDIHDHDKSENFQTGVSISISAENAKNDANRQKQEQGNDNSTGGEQKQNKEEKGNPLAVTVDGTYGSRDRRQINRATIGEGEIIIRSDPAAGLEGLNRDLAKAQEITKDSKTSVTVYIDSSAIDEIASGGAGIVDGFEKTSKKIQQLANEFQAITASLPPEMSHLGEAGLTAMRDMIRADVPDEAIAELMSDEQFQTLLTRAADLTNNLESSNDLDAVLPEAAGYLKSTNTNGEMVLNIHGPRKTLGTQVLNLFSAAKQYIDSIPYKEEAQFALVGLQTAFGGPVKTAVSLLGNAAVESIVGEQVEQIKTEAATKLASWLIYANPETFAENNENYGPSESQDKAVDAAKFGLNLTVGAVGAVVAGKAVLADMTKAVATFKKMGIKDIIEFDAKTIRFTQDTVSNKFKNGKSVKGFIDDLKAGNITSEDIPAIRVFEKGGKIYSLDNRRLKAFQDAGVPIRVQKATAQEVANELPNKFSTVTDGLTIKVRGGGL